MRNIRLDSLSSDREVASQSYGFRLRWDQGVASRGKLMGKSVPLRPPIKHGVPRTHEQTRTSRIRKSTDEESSPCRQPQVATENSLVVLSHPKQNVELVDRHVRQAAHAVLFQHFNHEVASRLAWLDGPKNPWRTLVLPLAQRSSCLRLSTLGLAAAHMSVVSPQDKAALVQIHRSLRDATLHHLNRQMESELNREVLRSDKNTQVSVLVEIILTMISLCYAEMFIPNSTGWRIHLSGIRTGFERYDLANPHEKVISQFFVEELDYLEAFGSISSFTSSLRRHKPISQHATSDDYFKEFTETLYEITITERSRNHASRTGKILVGTDMALWQDKLTRSYDSVCARIDSTPSQDVAIHIGLKSVLKAQYYACLVYSYQALASDIEKTVAIPPLIDFLYNEIIFMTSCPTESVSHNISFPLFILGTASQLYTDKQVMIERLFTENIAATGFSCNSAVLQFLRDFWNATAAGSAQNWIQYARANEERISPFIVF
ncbi:fungal specific transcription factor factor domain-containing protein [Fusarium mundagurra]|uniref:Fungal specific transcription factor factor domain-containing protein n=1 Tax=Fusarium mundagurra TaxID=1567541 RepID=A0A8H6D9T6_9HYPO|nr:fungal specific transcription factor factor domain-containing protein [Fusarium mundagurra]